MHPILFSIAGRYFTTYSVLFVAGYVAGALWLRTQLKYHGAAASELWEMVASVVAGALIGSKLGFFIVGWRAFAADPRAMLRDWSTGWVFWSGLLCGIAAGGMYKLWHDRRYRPRAYLPVADYWVAAVALGHVLGRLGCFLEGCCYGRPTTLPWGVAFTDPACGVADRLKGLPLHPTQLYEAFSEAAAAAVLIGWVLPRIRAGRYRYGTAFLGYLLYYSAMRFAVECVRGDDRGVLLSPLLSPSQWVSLFAGLVAAAALWKRGVVERDLAHRSLFSDGKP